MKETKKQVYARHGIEYKSGKILSPIGWVKPPLVNGNAKIGKGVYHFSTLPGTQLFDVVVNGRGYTVKGSCACDCVGCYAKSGNYRYQSVKNALGMRTILAREYVDFLERAIRAQIEADHIGTVRIHAAGDFLSLAYAVMWYNVAKDYSSVIFWTYTKVRAFEMLFDKLANGNIVKSLLPGGGVNYGHVDYVTAAYETLTAAGESVHICRCGVDKNQHCAGCKACSENKYVLFLEHSTEYKAEKDPGYNDFVALVNGQDSKKENGAA